jgi:hypothetical protein
MTNSNKSSTIITSSITHKAYLIFILELYSRAAFTFIGHVHLQTRLFSRCLAMTASINFAIQSFSHKVTIRCNPCFGILVFSQEMLKTIIGL